jgi:hypothetical protein
MTIARATNPKNGNQIFMLGLSRENINRLQQDKPIHIKKYTHGEGVPEGWDIVLFFGETEQEMQKMFVKHGMIGPETKVHIDPRLVS